MFLDSLVERPGDGLTTAVEAAEELKEDLLGDVNVVGSAAHALVLDGGSGGLAATVDGDGLAAHGVAVGLGAHETDSDGDNAGALVLAAVVLTARAEADGVVGDVTGVLVAAGAAGADAVVGSRSRGLAGRRRG